jgi:nucleoid-associated protein YgaU
MKKLLLVASIILLFIFAGIISAQSLKDNPDYIKALEYQKSAEEALNQGNYDKALADAIEAEKYSKKAGEYADSMLVAFQAKSLIAYLENQFSTMDKNKAQSDYPDDYANMMNDFDAAKVAFDAGDYQGSLDSAKKAKEALDNLVLAMAAGAATPEPEVTPEPEETDQPEETEPPVITDQPVYPKYYVVEWNPDDRDNLWKISGFTFVYNDPFKWENLYEANKSTFVDPENPRFISPEQILEIPSISGETREGTYEPGKTYPVFPK